jgi:hypothetical protein
MGDMDCVEAGRGWISVVVVVNSSVVAASRRMVLGGRVIRLRHREGYGGSRWVMVMVGY